VCILLNSCQQDSSKSSALRDMSFGKSVHYPSFLFFEGKNDTLTKIIHYRFNDWAKNQGAYIVLKIVDKDGNSVTSNLDFKVMINDEVVSDGKFNLKTNAHNEGELEIGFVLPSSKNSNYFEGYIYFVIGNLDRVNDIEHLNSEVPVFTWSAHQEVQWNPYETWLYTILAVLIVLLFIWLVLLRPFIYRRFNKNRSIIITSPFYKKVPLKKGINLTLTNEGSKQSVIERFFKGKELVYVNPFFKNPLIVRPRTKKKIRLRMGSHYKIEPFRTTLKKGQQTYSLKNQNNEKIKFTYN
jgi:hypothetical protein